jgi:hypothetical protein
MAKYDTTYQAFRRDQLNKYREMDPDVLISELDVDTDILIEVLWFKIEEKIQEDYNNGYENEEEE